MKVVFLDVDGVLVHAKTVAWKQTGHAAKSPGLSARMGRRIEHYDFNY